MRYLIFILLLLGGFTVSAQIVKTAGIPYTATTPAHTPSSSGSWWALDTANLDLYAYYSGAWNLAGERIQSIVGCVAPAYTPGKGQALFVVNACDSLYYYRSGAWHWINTDTSGYNSSLTYSGDTLYLTDGGGTLSVVIAGGGGGDNIYNSDGDLPANETRNVRLDTESILSFAYPTGTGAFYVYAGSDSSSTDAQLLIQSPLSNAYIEIYDYEMTVGATLNTTVYSVDSTKNILSGSDGSPGQVIMSSGTKSYWGYVDSSSITAGALSITDIGQHGASTGQVLKWNGTQWAAGTDNTGSAGAGQNNVGDNLGSGVGIYEGKIDTTLRFKSLVDGHGIDIAAAATEITVSVDTSQLATINDINVVQADIDAHELADADTSMTNEIQSISIDSVVVGSNERFSITISSGNTINFDVPQVSSISDGDKGDIDVTASGAIWTVDTSAITTVKIAVDAVDSTKIGTGAVSVTDIGQHGAASGEVLKWNGTQWAPSADNTGGIGGGENNVGKNLGNGTVIYAGKIDTTLEFKSLLDGYGLNLSNTDTTVTVSVDTSQLATINDINVVQADIDAHELADADTSMTNEGILGVSNFGSTTAILLSNTPGQLPLYIGPAFGSEISVGTSNGSNGGVIVIANTAPDQVVSLTGGGIVSISGTYPNFTITGTEAANGIYSGDGTIPNGTDAALTASGTFDINYSDNGSAIAINDALGTTTLFDGSFNSTVSVEPTQAGITSNGTILALNDQGVFITADTLDVTNVTTFLGLPTGGSSIDSTTARNTGASGEGVYSHEDANVLNFKKLIAGSNITLTPADSSITIAASGGGSASVITPSEITSDQDNYSPTDWATATIVRISGDSMIRAITGFASVGIADGHEKKLINVGSYPIYIPGEHPDSQDSNRVSVGYDYMIYPKATCWIMYDNTLNRWVITSQEGEWARRTYNSIVPASTTAADFGDLGLQSISGSSGTSAATAYLPSSINLNTTATASSGFAAFYNKSPTAITTAGASHINSRFLISLSDTSDNTNDFCIEARIAVSVTAADSSNNSVGLRYNHKVNSGNFLIFSRSAAGSENTTDSGIPVVAGKTYSVSVHADKANSEARVYIDGVFAGRVSTNVTSASAWSPGVVITRTGSIGTSTRTLRLHHIGYNCVFP